MVCPRCILAIESILNTQKIDYYNVALGRIELKSELNNNDLESLNNSIKELGFELVSNESDKLINQIKSYLIEVVNEGSLNSQKNPSQLLEDKLHKSYGVLSKHFSSVTGTTIERYLILLRIEKVKELLCYTNLTNSEIAFKEGYSSAAYLSNQFKKETGMTPTEFKKMANCDKRSIDTL